MRHFARRADHRRHKTQQGAAAFFLRRLVRFYGFPPRLTRDAVFSAAGRKRGCRRIGGRRRSALAVPVAVVVTMMTAMRELQYARSDRLANLGFGHAAILVCVSDAEVLPTLVADFILGQ